MSRVKFSVSSFEDEIPAAELVGYSQSMSMPSRPNSRTTAAQLSAKRFRRSAVEAISLNRPLPHPPMDRHTLASPFAATICRSRSGWSMRTASKDSLT